jgi:hypothetical protein
VLTTAGELDAALALLLVSALLVVAGTLVVTAVTLVVDAGIEDVVVTADFEDAPVLAVVVAADAEAREAEKEEQRPNPTDAATWRSDWLQAERRQGVMALWMAEIPDPHWQASSLTAQPAIEIAETRQDLCFDKN